jgi:hypothetical protein
MQYRSEIKHTLERMLDDKLQTSRKKGKKGKENNGEVVLSRVNC